MRIVNVSSKMHELAGGVDVDDPHFEARGAFSSLSAYNRSKLCQARPPPPRQAIGFAGSSTSMSVTVHAQWLPYERSPG